MKCYYHPNRDAVAQCVECNRGLCSECAHKWEPPLCKGCGSELREYAKKELGKIKIGFIGGLICGLLGGIAIWYENNINFVSELISLIFTTVMCAYSFAGLSIGWKKMNEAFSKINFKFFLILPILGWIIYFCVVYMLKFMLAYIIGWFVLPKEYKRLKSILND